MAAFICDRCGRCCISLGQSITIERQLNDRDYYCRSQIDNSIFLVHVEPAFREEIAEEYGTGDTARSAEKRPCPFLRRNPERDGMTCAIYATRPKVCRDFRCYKMIVVNRDGTPCGRVIGKNTLRTADPALQEIWDKQAACLPCNDFGLWSRQVSAILADNGYRAEPVE